MGAMLNMLQAFRAGGHPPPTMVSPVFPSFRKPPGPDDDNDRDSKRPPPATKLKAQSKKAQ